MAENNNANAAEAEAVAAVVAVEEKVVKDTEAAAPAGGEPPAPATTKRNAFFAMNNMEKLLATVTLILSIPVLGFVVWIFYVRGSDCESILKLPGFQVAIGIGLIVLFLISNGVVFMRSRFPVLGLMIVMVPLLLMFIIGLALVGAYKMESRSVAASPKWLRVKVFNDAHWDDIKSCIYDMGACDDLVSRTLMLKSYDFSLKKLSSLEVIILIHPLLFILVQF